VEELSALLDGELPPSGVASLTEHLTTCPVCAQRLAELGALRAALAEAVPEEDVSPEFLGRITHALDHAVESAAPVLPFRRGLRPPRVRSFALGLAAAAIAAMVVFAVLPRQDKTVDLMAVRDAALRSTLGGGAPLAGPALTVAGFRLIGAHADIIAGHPSRVMVYARQGETVTLCIWKAHGEPAHGLRMSVFRGVAIRYWNDGIDEYWAAGAGPAEGLQAFVDAVRMARS
jgi:anti-sigma factor RsiW